MKHIKLRYYVITFLLGVLAYSASFYCTGTVLIFITAYGYCTTSMFKLIRKHVRS